MRPLIKRKLFAGLISATGAAVLAMGSLTAGASAAPNPNEAQATNVPYVAWVGEHVRLVICEPELTEIADKAGVNIHSDQSFYGAFNANFAVEDWSGYQFQPPTPDGDAASAIGQYFDPGPAAFFLSSKGQACVGTDYKSLNPGLTRIRLAVKSDSGGEIVYSHQFLVIWLTANKPVLNEAGTSASGTETFQNQLEGSGPSNLSNFLGDKAGDGKFLPSPFSGEETDKGLVQIKVTGNFPVISGTPLSNILTSSSYTLPEAWPTLAKTLSSSSEETEEPGSNPGLWDIHETLNSSNEAGPNPLNADFSRPAFGDDTSGATATVGPYDPQAANETLLSDGTLNAEDAPMPAMRIDVSLAKNEPGGLGGVGQIEEVLKSKIYSHDFEGDTAAGNLYNPYYGAYIPATDRGTPQSSGVTGPSPGGDFPGFLNKHPGPYTFWESVKNANNRGSSHSTGCLRRVGADPSEYETPSDTPQTQTFYTDERGETYVTYTPGDGFYLENLPVYEGAKGESEEGKIIKNENGGCDLKGLFGKEIGNSVISARAVYPYEPVDYTAQASENTLTKTVTSDWEKEWFEFPKGNGANEANVKLIVAKAQDIDGSPFVDEKVCFHAEQNSGLKPYSGTSPYIKDLGNLLGKGPSVYVGGSSVDGGQEGTAALCVNTNSEGLATVEIENSSFGKVDLTVTYEEEHIIRDHDVLFPTNAGGLKEAKEAEEAAAKSKEAATEKAAKEAAAEKAANEAAEKVANEKRAKEVTEKTITEAQATEKAAAEKAANEAAEKAANEKRTQEVEAANVTPVTLAAVTTNTTSGSTTSGSTTSGSTPLLTPAPALSLGTVSGSTASLTEAQKLAKALKACKKLPKSKRAKCEAQARKAHSAKNKKHKK